MKSSWNRSIAAALLLASLFTATGYVGQAAAAEEASPASPLVALCHEAKGQFRPLNETDLAELKVELADAVARLDERLDADGVNGIAWAKYLRMDSLRAQVARGKTPEVETLDELSTLFAADHEGLNLVWFLDVHEAMRRYTTVARGVDNPAMQSNYEQLVDFLAPWIEKYLAEPTLDNAAIIGQVVRQLEDARQAPELVRAIRQELQRPNLWINVSANLIDAAVGRPVDDVSPVREVILKTDVYGTGHTIGRLTAETVDDPDRGLIETILRADVSTKSIGYHGPVCIYSNGATKLVARKQIAIDATGLVALPSTADATTRSTTTAIRARNGNKLIERIAWKQSAKQKCEADCIASQLSELRVRQRMDRETAELLERANRDFTEKFRNPLVERKLFPQRLEFSSTPAALGVVSLAADAGQLAAPTPAPVPKITSDLAVCVHESMIGNLAASALSGVTLDQERLEAIIIQLAGKLPEQLAADEDQRDWAITFPRTQPPISVRFDENRLSLTIRGQRFFQGGESYPGMEISVEYEITQTENGFLATRQGEMQIVPLRVASSGSRQLSSREVVIRTLLQRRFDKIFKEELLGKGFALPEQFGSAGTMSPVMLESQDGWLTAAWQCVAGE